MAEVDITYLHTADLNPSKGRGIKLIGADIQPDTNETFTTGLSEISGMGYVVESDSVGATLPLLAVQISSGTITFEVGDIDAYGACVGQSFRLLVMGVVR